MVRRDLPPSYLCNTFARYTGSEDKERLQQRCADCVRALQAVVEKEKRKILSPQQPLSMLESAGAEGGGVEPVLKAEDPTWQLVSALLLMVLHKFGGYGHVLAILKAMFSCRCLQLRNKLKAALMANIQQQQQQLASN